MRSLNWKMPVACIRELLPTVGLGPVLEGNFSTFDAINFACQSGLLSLRPRTSGLGWSIPLTEFVQANDAIYAASARDQNHPSDQFVSAGAKIPH